MKTTTLIFFLFSSLLMFSQETSKLKRHYMPLDDYKKTYNKELTKKDSLNLIVKDNVILVLINETETISKNGRSVIYEYKDDTFLDIYKKIAFNHKNDSFSTNTKMKYWKEDIKIFFSKSVPKKTKKQFLKFAKNSLSEVDSLKLKEVNKVEKSNYIIYYSQDYEFESRLTNNKYSNYWVSWRNNNLIYKTSLRVRTDKLFNEKLRLHKMKTLFLETLGYFKFNAELDCENFFSGCYQENPKLSELDKEIIKYHYSYGICKGTSIEVFENQHKNAKKLLKETNISMRFFHSYE